MLSLRVYLAGSLDIKKIIIIFHGLTGVEFEHVLTFFDGSVYALQLFRDVIRVGTLDDKISKISIAYLSHDLVDLPVFAGLVLVAIRDCS